MAPFNVRCLSSPEASLCCGEPGEKEKDSARGTMGKGKREERPLPYDVRFSGRICGSVVVAKPADYLDAFERTHRAPNYGILDSSPIPQGLCFHRDNFDPILTR